MQNIPDYHIGVDEAGRGCLAGPVVAAAVLFPPGFEAAAVLPGLGDSKKLSVKKRDELAPLIRRYALAWGLGLAWPQEIDRVNILNATFRAMSRAVARLAALSAPLPLLLIDGNHAIPKREWDRAFPLPDPPVGPACPDSSTTVTPQGMAISFPTAQHPIIAGDALYPAISAASILAKTWRDGLMQKLDPLFPGYGFAAHKGYGVAKHLTALAELGPCDLHRKTFRKVRPEQEQLRPVP